MGRGRLAPAQGRPKRIARVQLPSTQPDNRGNISFCPSDFGPEPKTFAFRWRRSKDSEARVVHKTINGTGIVTYIYPIFT